MADIVSVIIDLIINIVVWTITVAPALWLSGRFIAGKENATFGDAVSITVVGTIVFYIINYALTTYFAGVFSTLLSSLITYLVLLLIWLALVAHFFDCGLLKAFAISIIAIIVAIVIWIVIGFILAMVGFATGFFPDPSTLLHT